MDDHRGRLFSVPGRPFRPSPSCLKKTAPFPSYPRTDGITPSRPVLSSSRTDGTVEFTDPGKYLYKPKPEDDLLAWVLLVNTWMSKESQKVAMGVSSRIMKKGPGE